jgi:hypothetical protein
MSITRRASFTALAASAVGGCATAAENASGLVTPAMFAAWLDHYGAAWEARDAAAAGPLFTENATYHEMPFDAPMQGRAAIQAYWARVTANQSDIQVTYEVIACAGDRGAAHWHAVFNTGADRVELDGMFVCRFADATHVSALQEWWHAKAIPGGASAS